MKYLILALMTLSIIPAFGAYSDIPKEPIVEFTYHTSNTAFIQKDYCFSLNVFDDRGSYHKYVDPSIGPLYKALVEIEIFPSHGKWIIEEIEGKTSKNGFFSACDFITTNQYNTHGLYNMTMTVSYGDSTLTKEIQFWTVNRNG